MKDTFLLLGRNGDIIAMLPFLKKRSEQLGSPVKLVVSEDYAPLLDGCSYVKAVPCPFRVSGTREALSWSRAGGLDPQVIQVSWNPEFQIERESFIIDMWRLAGDPDGWFDGRPVFDNQSRTRRAALMKEIGRVPDVLVATDGKSSPLDISVLLNRMADELPHLAILNLSAVQCERIYDLIPLLEKAKCLVTIDTAHLHLSTATGIPTIALVTDERSKWHGSPPYYNQTLRVPYSALSYSENEIIREVRRLTTPVPFVRPRLVHVFSQYSRDGASARRHAMAKRTWDSEQLFPVWDDGSSWNSDLKRTFDHPAEEREMPFIKDLIDRACDQSKENDIIVLTNDDICFTEGLTTRLLRHIPHGPAFAHRMDSYSMIDQPISPADVPKLHWYAGSDLFAFTKDWWTAHRDEYPDMVLGREAWDWVMRELIKSRCGIELHHAIYHERHKSPWSQQRLTLPGNIHNRRLARAWLTERGLPTNEISSID